MMSSLDFCTQRPLGFERSSKLAAACALALLAGAVSAAKADMAVVDFESTPPLSTGPSIYVAVPGPQTITTTPATFSGGVVLGFATFFPAISFATAPNVYGTADFGNHLSETLNIDINPAFATTEVSFALFNGETFGQSYVVNAFNGTSLVTSQTLTNVAPNFNSGFGIIDLIAAAGITNVTVAPVGTPSAFDFLIDTIAFNQSINAVVPTPPPNQPNDPPLVLPPAPPVQGHRHGHGQGETELLEVDFGDDVNDIRGSVQVVTNTPEPAALSILGMGAIALLRRRRA